MRPKKKKTSPAMLVTGLLLVTAAAYYCAAGMHAGETIFQWSNRMKIILQHPAEIYLNGYTGKTLLVFFLIYALAALMFITGRKNYLTGREMGSAQFADVKKVNQRLADLSHKADDPENIIVIKRKKEKSRKNGDIKI